MTQHKQVAAAALLALAVMTTPVHPAVSTGAVPLAQLGVGLSVDSRWIAVEGYYSVRDRGAGAREQAWAGDTPSRGAAGGADAAAAPRQVRVVRLAAVPNLVGRTHHNFIAVRALTQAAIAVARHVMGAVIGGADLTGSSADAATLSTHIDTDADQHGARDADRR